MGYKAHCDLCDEVVTGVPHASINLSIRRGDLDPDLVNTYASGANVLVCKKCFKTDMTEILVAVHGHGAAKASKAAFFGPSWKAEK
jgi:hypothetical protein